MYQYFRPYKSLVGFIFIATTGISTTTAEENNKQESVVVTATRFDASIESAPVNMTIINAEDIEKSTANNVAQVLETLGGVYIKDLFGGTSSKSSVDMGGFGATGSSNTLVLMNGRRLNDADLAGVNLNAIPLNAVEKIEVIHGNASVLYGDNATSGVINIVTKSGFGAPSTNVQFNSGTHSTQGAHLSYTGSSQPFATFVSANKESSKGYRENSAFDNQNALADFSIAGADAIFGIKLHGSDEELELPGELDEATYNDNPRASSPPTEFLNENRAAGEFYIEQEQFAAELAYRNRNQHSFVFGDVNSDMKTSSFTPRYKTKFHKHSLTIGGDFYKSDLDVSANFTTAFNKSSLERKDAALYASGTINIPTQTSINLGIRRQRVEIDIDSTDVLTTSESSEQKTDLATAWDLTVNQRLTSIMRIYIRYAEGMRFPVLDEMWSYFDGSINILDTQSSRHIEAGSSIQLSSNTRLSFSAFRMEIDKEIGFDVATFSNVNFDETLHTGVDLSLRTEVLPWWHLNATANWRDAQFTNGPNEDKHIPEIPKWRATVSQTFSVSSGQQLGLDVIYTGERYFADDFQNQGKKMSDYTIFNMYYEKAVGTWFLKLNINNLADKKAADYGVYRSFSPNPYHYYPLPERTLLVSFGAKLN